MKARVNNKVLLICAAAPMVILGAGCSNAADNRTPTTQEVQAANENRFKNIEKLPIPENQKKKMESEMGGPAYTDPVMAKQIEAAKAHGAKIGPHDRPF